MHDLVHDLLLQLSEKEHLHDLVVSSNVDVHVPSSVKHLSLDHKREAHCTSAFFKNVMMARNLQTLSLIAKVEKNIPFQRCKCLRILKLRYCNLKKLTDSIGDLLHLRYLDLSYTEIQVLPKSVGKLYHLQTLKLLWCPHLKKFPEDMRKLISLRHFEFDKEHGIPFVGDLTSLRTLSIFRVGQENGRKIEELGRMKHLGGEICIRNLENVGSKEEAAKADLFEKKNLYKIEFIWSSKEGDNRNDNDVLEGLLPPTNTKILNIVNYSGDNFPTWVTTIGNEVTSTALHKLVDITLTNCSRCSELPMFDSLPSLKNLELRGMDNLICLSSSLSHDDDVTTGSRKPLSLSLRSLRLLDMDKLEKWVDGATNSSTMLSPVLESLYIFDCPKITLIDESHHHPLISLQIQHCENLESIQSIEGLTSLGTLKIHLCHSLLDVPDLHNQSCSLKRLAIEYCNKLTSFVGKLDCLESVKEVELGPFSNELHTFPSLQGIENLGNLLHTLMLNGGGYYESLPEEIKHLTALSNLRIWGFGIQELPFWLTNMSSVRFLDIHDCPGLDKEAVIRGAPREVERIQFDYQALDLHKT